jgi:hypothetical protein
LFLSLQIFSTALLPEPDYPYPDIAGMAFPREYEIESLEHAAIAHVQQGIYFSERDPLLDFLAHAGPVRYKAETHDTPPTMFYSTTHPDEEVKMRMPAVALGLITASTVPKMPLLLQSIDCTS